MGGSPYSAKISYDSLVGNVEQVVVFFVQQAMELHRRKFDCEYALTFTVYHFSCLVCVAYANK